uniref:Uncharacterized protein n=1 Tax=Geospiza parvula TaxID=87175 RepID=A0A8U8AYC0_GEOPR
RGAGGGGGGGERRQAGMRRFTWKEIGQRNGLGPAPQERWLVIHRKVYDISHFYRRHPGGARLLVSHAGQDATVSREMLVKDFRELRATVERMGLLEPNQLFFFLLLAHIFVAPLPSQFLFSSPPKVFFLLFQVQASWLQHDLGHLSVFRKTKWNHLLHKFVMCHLIGASAKWWTLLHSQHHAKPNCFHKDPDIDMHPFLFTLGKKFSVELGIKKKKYMPYNHQHKYFFISEYLYPPAIPCEVLKGLRDSTFDLENLRKTKVAESKNIIKNQNNNNQIFGRVGDLRHHIPDLPHPPQRMLESSWFVWVSQMNHIPMDIDYDKNLDWVSTQLLATCNVEQSLFNDWFTGHLNFQIEHHLFPTMPRHNYCKVAPLVKSLCAKHGLEYQCKPLLTAFADIVQ